MHGHNSLTAELVAHCLDVGRQPLPADARRVAAHSLLDWCAVALAAWGDDAVRFVHAEATAEGGHAQASLLDGSRTSAALAAWVNGTAGHVLDFDDVHLQSRVHPSVPLWPAILAEAESSHCAGSVVLQAFAAGVEMQSRLASVMGEDHYARGWHNTATLGTFGAAMAVATLRGLDVDQACRAMGLAASSAAGLRAAFGTMCKPLHAGQAAMAGLRAARLAQRGMSAPVDTFSSPTGYVNVHAAHHASQAALADRGSLRLSTIVYKYNASCYGTQAPIEAAKQLRPQLHDPLQQIDTIDVALEEQYLSVCCIADPQPGAPAKFSVAHAVALALSGRSTVAASSFTDAVGDDTLRALRRRVTAHANVPMPRAQAEVTVTLRDGTRLSARYDASQPEPDLNRQEQQLVSKAQALLADWRHEPDRARLIGALLAINDAADVANTLQGVLTC